MPDTNSLGWRVSLGSQFTDVTAGKARLWEHKQLVTLHPQPGSRERPMLQLSPSHSANTPALGSMSVNTEGESVLLNLI